MAHCAAASVAREEPTLLELVAFLHAATAAANPATEETDEFARRLGDLALANATAVVKVHSMMAELARTAAHFYQLSSEVSAYTRARDRPGVAAQGPPPAAAAPASAAASIFQPDRGRRGERVALPGRRTPAPGPPAAGVPAAAPAAMPPAEGAAAVAYRSYSGSSYESSARRRPHRAAGHAAPPRAASPSITARGRQADREGRAVIEAPRPVSPVAVHSRPVSPPAPAAGARGRPYLGRTRRHSADRHQAALRGAIGALPGQEVRRRVAHARRDEAGAHRDGDQANRGDRRPSRRAAAEAEPERVACSVHGGLRTITNMLSDGAGGWRCLGGRRSCGGGRLGAASAAAAPKAPPLVRIRSRSHGRQPYRQHRYQ
jgi:hypothetical protein